MIQLLLSTAVMDGPPNLPLQAAGGTKLKGSFVLTTTMASVTNTSNIVYEYCVELMLAHVLFCFQIWQKRLSTIGHIRILKRKYTLLSRYIWVIFKLGNPIISF